MPTTNRVSAGKAVLKTAEALGIERVFGIPGHHILDIYDHLGESDLEHIMGKNEEGVIRAANAVGRATGTPTMAFISAGPGAINSMTGIGEATALSIPVVVIVGAEPKRDGPHNIDSPTAVPQMFAAISKDFQLVEDPREVPEMVNRAFAVAQRGRPGPAVVQIPMDTLKATAEYSRFDTPQAEMNPLAPSSETVTIGVDSIERAERPLVVMGQGGLRAGMTNTVDSLATQLGAPVVVTQRGMGGYVDRPRYCGGYAPTVMHTPAERVADEADLIVGIGVRESLRRYYGTTFEGEKIYLCESLERHETGTALLSGDLERTAERLCERVRVRSSDWWEELAAAGWDDEEKHRREVAEAEIAWPKPIGGLDPAEFFDPADTPVHPALLMETLNQVVGPNAVYTTDIGAHTQHAMRYLELSEPNSFFGPENWGAMGHALPSAIGAKVARPTKDVVAIAGDGGFLMTMQEYKTAVEEKLDLVICIVNNHQHNAIHMDMQTQYGESGFTGIPGFDYVAFAESAGGTGYRVRDRERLSETLERAQKEDGPVLVDVLTMPNVA
jgi:acetolactate synthase-1/2/3 large subunit